MCVCVCKRSGLPIPLSFSALLSRCLVSPCGRRGWGESTLRLVSAMCDSKSSRLSRSCALLPGAPVEGASSSASQYRRPSLNSNLAHIRHSPSPASRPAVACNVLALNALRSSCMCDLGRLLRTRQRGTSTLQRCSAMGAYGSIRSREHALANSDTIDSPASDLASLMDDALGSTVLRRLDLVDAML